MFVVGLSIPNLWSIRSIISNVNGVTSPEISMIREIRTPRIRTPYFETLAAVD
jgi:hypothetical protein